MTQTLQARLGSYNINSILASGLLLPIAAVVLLVLALVYRGNLAVVCASGLWGIWGLIGYMANPALRLGSSARILYYLLFIVVLATALVFLNNTLRENGIWTALKGRLKTFHESKRLKHG